MEIKETSVSLKGLRGPFDVVKASTVHVPEYMTMLNVNDANDIKNLKDDFYGPLLYAINNIKEFMIKLPIGCQCGNNGTEKIHFFLLLKVKKINKVEDVYLTCIIQCECGHEITVDKNVGHERPCSTAEWENKIRKAMLSGNNI